MAKKAEPEKKKHRRMTTAQWLARKKRRRRRQPAQPVARNENRFWIEEDLDEDLEFAPRPNWRRGRRPLPFKERSIYKKGQAKRKSDDVLFSITRIRIGSRSEYVKAVWHYIKDNKLQKEGDGRTVVLDDRLATFFMGIKGQEVNGFTMLRFIEARTTKANRKTRWKYRPT